MFFSIWKFTLMNILKGGISSKRVLIKTLQNPLLTALSQEHYYQFKPQLSRKSIKLKGLGATSLVWWSATFESFIERDATCCSSWAMVVHRCTKASWISQSFWPLISSSLNSFFTHPSLILLGFLTCCLRRDLSQRTSSRKDATEV